jgi:hypothetical protein
VGRRCYQRRITLTVTAYIYDWNILLIGQRLALRHLDSHMAFPPLQAPASYNLSQVTEQINEQKPAHTTGQLAGATRYADSGEC